MKELPKVSDLRTRQLGAAYQMRTDHSRELEVQPCLEEVSSLAQELLRLREVNKPDPFGKPYSRDVDTERIVVQPNRKYARFADPVDNFTHYDMTRDEALKLCSQYPGMGRLESEEKVARAEADPMRWTDSLRTICAIHGVTERENAENFGGKP